MRAVCSWSGGKDAAYALGELDGVDESPSDSSANQNASRSGDVEELLTTVSASTNRSTMHGVRRGLYERQADALGLSVEFVTLPPEPTNETYEAAMAAAMDGYAERGFTHIAFADLYLESVRAYREELLAEGDLTGCWPVWGRDTRAVAEAVTEEYEAIVVCVDGDVFDPSFAGRRFDEAFLADLPAGVDPCGENGEFHTFVTDGPIFEESVEVRTGETVTRTAGDGEFHYCDLVAPE